MIVKVKSKLLIIIFSLIIIGMIYSVTEVLFPRDYPATISIEGSPRSQKLIKEQQNNHYYISFLEYDNGNSSTIKVECTKEQYDFIQSGKEYHMIYVKNYFNRKTGKVKILDDKPIIYGRFQMA
ncbi:MAG: hypothetical protein F8N39_00840 [Clostridiaceae bacterium]|nr:hypothetical protein [Clostridiaceae bacterium]